MEWNLFSEKGGVDWFHIRENKQWSWSRANDEPLYVYILVNGQLKMMEPNVNCDFFLFHLWRLWVTADIAEGAV